MNDLINRHEAINAFEELEWYRIQDGELKQGASNEEEALFKYTDVIKVVERLPSASDVVRCKNCCGSEQRGNATYCKVWNRYTTPRGFCHLGERRNRNAYE